MFKSLEWRSGYWKIIDDDFVEIIQDEDIFIRWSFAALIKVYEDKNLNVAKNIFLYFKSVNSNYWSIQNQINNFAIKEPELYLKYKDEIEKYLPLL
jgi:hypothetical protein